MNADDPRGRHMAELARLRRPRPNGNSRQAASTPQGAPDE